MKKIDTIIFDLGGVLIDWNPAYVFDRFFNDDEKKKYFFANVCTSEWNEQQDAGRLIQDATNELVAKHPDWEEAIRAYYGRWPEMLGGPITATVEVFRELKAIGLYKFYALTNWSAELFPVALDRFDFLHWFDGRLVSGEEKMRKPFPEFYQRLLDKFNIDPSQAVFIDDNHRNIEGAEVVGIKGILFQNARQLQEDLKNFSIYVE